jgi:hypothetical protein
MGITMFQNLIVSGNQDTQVREKILTLVTIAYGAALCEITLSPLSKL